MLSLLDLTRAELQAQMQTWGQPAFRGDQIYAWLHKDLVASADGMSNLPKDLRDRLTREVGGDPLRLVVEIDSRDRLTRKALFRLPDGATIEVVLMLYNSRRTVCISTQVGCGMGCTFCATGLMGIKRNLTPAEIVGQVVAMLNHHAHPEGRPVNLVFMGMGEPLHNLDHVMAAFRILTDPRGLAIPPRRVTLSTSGLVPGIARLATFHPRPRLALSLKDRKSVV